MQECMRSCHVALYMSFLQFALLFMKQHCFIPTSEIKTMQHLCSELNSFQQKTFHLFLSLNSSASFSLLTLQFFQQKLNSFSSPFHQYINFSSLLFPFLISFPFSSLNCSQKKCKDFLVYILMDPLFLYKLMDNNSFISVCM